jgi:hypothetical protein
MQESAVLLVRLVLVAGSGRSDPCRPAGPGVPDGITATFSIAAIDPATGVCGGAVASKYPAVGKVVVHARPGVGAICRQHLDIRPWAPKALDLLEDGKLPEEVLGELQRADKLPAPVQGSAGCQGAEAGERSAEQEMHHFAQAVLSAGLASFRAMGYRSGW